MLSAVSAVLYTAAGAECCLLYASCPEAGYRHTFLVGALMVMHDAVGFLERRGFRPLETPFDGTTSLCYRPDDELCTHEITSSRLHDVCVSTWTRARSLVSI